MCECWEVVLGVVVWSVYVQIFKAALWDPSKRWLAEMEVLEHFCQEDTHGCLIVGCSDSRILPARTMFCCPRGMVNNALWWVSLVLIWAYGAISPDGWRHGRLSSHAHAWVVNKNTKSIFSINEHRYDRDCPCIFGPIDRLVRKKCC
jgi:hypothetical protein